MHLQEKPRSRNGPIPSVYDSVSAYIEREGRAPPENIAGWLADELHYTLKYDPSWQDGGHNSASRLVAFISTVVARQLERDELGGLYFDPTKGAPETSGHRYQPGRVLCGAAHSQIAIGEDMQELSRDFDALGRNARMAKLAGWTAG